ncbi:hypothetical protein QAD02_006859 [Eretmocerus hayati]|uniref:Uncharacterized protein n=1 Tax=Eretmocerus hayati TaxID=131215 RepID=A0ACC2N2D7_9HYME|nr:hypothetical protein QAD02_006859 [Eretmocerus hayati]
MNSLTAPTQLQAGSDHDEALDAERIDRFDYENKHDFDDRKNQNMSRSSLTTSAESSSQFCIPSHEGILRSDGTFKHDRSETLFETEPCYSIITDENDRAVNDLCRSSMLLRESDLEKKCMANDEVSFQPNCAGLEMEVTEIRSLSLNLAEGPQENITSSIPVEEQVGGKQQFERMLIHKEVEVDTSDFVNVVNEPLDCDKRFVPTDQCQHSFSSEDFRKEERELEAVKSIDTCEDVRKLSKISSSGEIIEQPAWVQMNEQAVGLEDSKLDLEPEEVWALLSQQSAHTDAQCNLINQEQPSISKMRQKNGEKNDVSDSKVSFESKQEDMDTKMLGSVQESDIDSTAPESSIMDLRIPVSERIFQAHKEAEERDLQALEQIKKNLLEKIRVEEQHEIEMQALTLQKASRLKRKQGNKDGELSPVRNRKILEESFIIAQQRTSREGGQSDEESDRKEKRSRTRTRRRSDSSSEDSKSSARTKTYYPGKFSDYRNYRRRTSTRRRINSPDHRKYRSRTSTRYPRDSFVDRGYVRSRTTTRFRRDSSGDNRYHQRGRSRWTQYVRDFSNDRSTRSRMRTRQRINPISDRISRKKSRGRSRKRSASKSRDRSHRKRFRFEPGSLECQKKTAVAIVSLRTKPSIVSPVFLSSDTEESGCHYESPKLSYKPTSKPIQRSTDEVIDCCKGSIDFKTAQHEFINSPECPGKEYSLDEGCGEEQSMGALLPDSGYPDENFRTKKADDFHSTQPGESRDKITELDSLSVQSLHLVFFIYAIETLGYSKRVGSSIMSSGGVQVPVAVHCLFDDSVEVGNGKASQMISGEETDIILSDLETRHDKRKHNPILSQSEIGETTGGSSRFFCNGNDSFYYEGFPAVCMNTKALLEQEKLRCVEVLDGENEVSSHIDRVRQIASVLIILNRELREGTRLSVVPHTTTASDLFESSFSFKRQNPETGKLEVEVFVVRYLHSNEAGLGIDINYQTLFTESLNIGTAYKLYNMHNGKLTSEEGKINKFTVHTNLELNNELLEKRGLRVIESCVENCKKIQLSEDCEIFEKFPNQILSKLAGVLVGVFSESNSANCTLFLKLFHVALIREKVLKIKETNNHTGNNTTIFHQDFIHNLNLSRSARELRYYILRLLHNEFCLQDLEIDLPQSFGKESINADNSVNVRKNLDGLENPFADFLGKIEFEKIPNNVDELLFRETGVRIKFLETQSVLKTIEDCLLKLMNSKDDIVNTWLEDIRGAISQKLVMDDQLSSLQIDLEFQKHELFSKLQHRLFGVSSCKRLTIQTDHAFLVSLMVQQIANQHLKVSKESHCCMRIKLEFNADMIFHFHNLIKFSSVNVLVVDCSHDSLNVENMRNIFSNLTGELNSLPLNTPKKIVIIGTERKLPRILKSDVTDFLLCLPGGIEMLSEKSQSKVLQQDEIQLRNDKVRLRELMDRENIVNLLHDPYIFTQFLTSKLSIDDVVPALPLYDQDNYVSRSISLHVVIDTKVLKEPNNDVFIVKNISKNELQDYSSKNEIVLAIDEVPKGEQYTRLISYEGDHLPDLDELFADDSRNIHLMEYKDGCLVWLYSSGSISSLVPHRLEEISESIGHSLFSNEFSSKQSQPKVIIVCGESGMGKSTYLHDRALSVPETTHHVWHLKINLNPAYFKNCDETCFDDVGSAVAHVKEHLDCSTFLREFFSTCLIEKSNLRITLFFDGFDELPPGLFESASQMILQLQDSFVEKIYVTVRPGINRQYLESRLCVFSHNLDPLGTDEECHILISSWNKNVELQIEQSVLGDFAKDFLSIFKSSFECENFRTVGNLAYYPLYLKMLAEVHKDCMTEDVNYPDTLNNIYDLYKTYIERTYPRIFYGEIVYKKSLQRLVPVSVLESLGIDEDDMEIPSSELPDELCHITFAEFAVADWLKTQASLLNQSRVKILQCIHTILDSTSPVFLNSLRNIFSLEEDHNCVRSFVDLPTAEDRARYLEAMIRSESHHIMSALSEADTTPDHAGESDHTESVEILRDLQDPDHRKLLRPTKSKCLDFKESKALGSELTKDRDTCQLAIDAVNVEVVYGLALTGGDLSRLDAECVRRISCHVARELCGLELLEEHKLRIVAEKLFLLAPEIVPHEADRIALYQKLLPYFFANGRVEVVQSLMNTINDRKEKNKLLQEKIQGKSLLDYVNDSKTLTDDLQRRNILKYLFGEIGIEMKDRDKCYVQSVLHSAIKVNHLKTFKYFVGQYPGGYTGFLESSLKSDDFEVVNFLINCDQKVRSCNIMDSILHTAVRSNVDLKMIQFIINKSSVDVTNNLRETPLCIAIKSKAHTSVVKYLINVGANVNFEDEKGLRPWCYILVEGSKYSTREQDDLMSYLVESNQELILPPARNLDYDYDRKRLDIIRKYEYYKNPAKYDLNYQNDHTPRLHAVIKSNTIEDWSWCKFLVVHGADVKLKDSTGKTPLHVAVELLRDELAKFLLKHGAIFDEPDNSGTTPLQLLVNISNDGSEPSAICSLWKSLMSCCDGRGRTLLHVASDTNNVPAMKKMIDIASPNSKQSSVPMSCDVRDFDGNAPIHLAVSKDHDFIVELLISGSANYEIKDYSQKTPLMIAREMCQFSLSTILLESIDELFQLVKRNDEKSMKKVIELVEENRCITNARDSYGMTALHWTAQLNDSSSFVRYLIKQSDSILNAVDHNKRTALHYATLRNHSKCAKALVEAGAIVDLVDEDGH